MDDGLQSVQATQGKEPARNDRLTASFGVVGDELYDSSRHKGESIDRNSADGKQYAIDQIDWILTEGQTVPGAGVRYQLDMYPILKKLDDPWQIPVVTSDLPSSKLPQSLKHDGVRILFHVELKPDFKAMRAISRLKNNLLYPWKPKFINFKCFSRFKIDPLTGRLSVTPLSQDGTPISCSRTIWEDPENLNDGCSAILIPPPMYSLTRPESTAASLFEKIAKQSVRRENGGEEGEDDISADENCLEDPDWDVGG